MPGEGYELNSIEMLKRLEGEALAESLKLVPAAGTVEPGPNSVDSKFAEDVARMHERAQQPPLAVYNVPQTLPLPYVRELIELLDSLSVESYEQADVRVKFDTEGRRDRRAAKLTDQDTPKW